LSETGSKYTRIVYRCNGKNRGTSPSKIFLQLPLKFSQQHADTVVGTSREQAGLPLEKSKFHCLQHSIATHLRDAGAVRVMASGDAAYPITSCAMGIGSDGKSHNNHSPIAQGKSMAEPQETQQEKETRWAAQRVAHETQQKDYRAARARTRGRHWLVVGAIVIIIAVIAAALLL
jgi:hypothetical protein